MHFRLTSPISRYYEILGRSNEKFHWGLEHESAKAGDCDNNVSASPPPRVQKVQMNSIIAITFFVFPSPISVLTTQTALTDRQNIIHRSSPPSQNFGVKGKRNR